MATAKVIVITGASSGIGAALARQLGQQGQRLVLAARRERELRQVTEPFGRQAVPVVTDVCQSSQVERLRDQALAEFGHVDVWINNAGRGIVTKVLELRDQDFDEMLAVNLKSAFYGMQAIVPHFQERGEGHLINVSTFLSRVPFVTFRSIYSAAKAALNSLTMQLRMDLAEEYPGIHVSLVIPGTVTTEFAANALHARPAPPGSPSGSQVKPQSADEVAAAIVALIERPAPELVTNPALADLWRRHCGDLVAFEAGLRR